MFFAKQLRVQNGTLKDSPANITSYTLDLDSSSCLPGGWNMSNGTNSSVVYVSIFGLHTKKNDRLFLD